MMRYDAIVIGIGGMGSAAAWHLASRGRRVLGLEQFTIPHEMGSSHGVTRIIRLAYSEHPSYVPLLRRAYELWRAMEQRAGEPLLVITGGVDVGRADSVTIEGSLRSCREHGLAHELLDAAEMERRFPGFQLPPDLMAVYQPEGGIVLPERSMVVHAAAARELGAEIHEGERVTEWRPEGGGVRVRTEAGEYCADRLVITAGPWASRCVPELARLAIPERQVLIWTEPLRPERFAVGAFPIFNMEAEEGRFYGFPEYGVPGFKLGKYHHLGQQTDPDRVDREFQPEDEAVLAGGHPALFSGCGRRDAFDEDVHVHELAGRALHPGFASGMAAGVDCRGVFGPRFQVRTGNRRDYGGPCDGGRLFAVRFGVVRAASLRLGAASEAQGEVDGERGGGAGGVCGGASKRTRFGRDWAVAGTWASASASASSAKRCACMRVRESRARVHSRSAAWWRRKILWRTSPWAASWMTAAPRACWVPSGMAATRALR